MTYRIAVRPAAGRELELLGPKLRVRVGAAIDALAGAPRPPNVRKLTGAQSLWRVRVGDYRVVYHIDDAARVVTILAVGHRRDVYR